MKKLCLMSFTVLLMAITMFSCTQSDNTADTTAAETEDVTVIETSADTELPTDDLTTVDTTEAPATEESTEAPATEESTEALTTATETEPLTTEAVTEPPIPLPTEVALPEAYSNADHEYKGGDGSILYTFKNKTADDYTAVCDNYKNLDFQVYCTTQQGDNLATTFIGKSVMAHVYWTAFNSELCIALSDTAADTLPPQTPEVTDGDYACSITQIEDTTFIGMCYVVQLKDGSYIVYDGGHDTWADKVIKFLTDNYKGEGKPTVRAWVLTHSHNDHTDAFSAIANNRRLRGRIKVEYVIVSQLNNEFAKFTDAEQSYLGVKFWEDVALFSGTKVVYARPGMNFKFCNLNMEVLGTQENVYKYLNSPIDLNNSNVITRLYDDNYKALFPGDMHPVQSPYIVNAFGEYLKSDVCQVAHHGNSNMSIFDFYDLVRAPIMFYPAAFSLYDAIDTYTPEIHWTLEKREYVKEILIHGVGQFTRDWGTIPENEEISIPNYTPKNPRPGEPPAGENRVSTDKTTYTEGESIYIVAYGLLEDWVGIVKKGETEPVRWWYMETVSGYCNASSGTAFDATKLAANTNGTGKLTAGEYTVVFVKDGKSLADGEPDFKLDITIVEGDSSQQPEENEFEPIIHLSFEDNAADNCDNVDVTTNGSVTYTDGYNGKGAVVGKNYFSIPNYEPGYDGFTISVWANISEITGDPALFATKNWGGGANVGFALGVRGDGSVQANIGNGSSRIDIFYTVEEGVVDTWVNYTMVVDRTAGVMKLSINFGEFKTVAIPAELLNAPYEGLGLLAIGQDATGNYSYGSMTAVIDEFMVFDYALSQVEIAKLAAMYGELEAPENPETPEGPEIPENPENPAEFPNPIVYLQFEDNADNSTGEIVVEANGDVMYTDGKNGKGAIVGEDYFSISEFVPRRDGFTISVWANVTEVYNGDPALFGTKDWDSGVNIGFALGVQANGRVQVNIGTGSERYDIFTEVDSFIGTWNNYTVVFDRVAGELKLSVNFGEFITTSIPTTLADEIYQGLGSLMIGQDGSGAYRGGKMSAVIDDFMLFDRALTQDELTELVASFEK